MILIGIEIVEPSIDDEAGITLCAVERNVLVRSSIGTCATRCADADEKYDKFFYSCHEFENLRIIIANSHNSIIR